MPYYDLVDEKWIPCILPDGNIENFGIKEVLVNAHKIKGISDSSPLVTTSLHRLLLAILHRNFGPENMREWIKLWNAQQWDAEKLSRYFEKWKPRFNLFDEERPFYQSLEIEDAKRHPILHLAIEASSGNNATLFDHNLDDSPIAVEPAVAARYTVATQSYAIGFGKSSPFYFSDSPLIRGLTVMTLGDSLFETLALNLIEYNEYLPFPQSGEDLPIWEQEKLLEPNRDGTPIRGYLDYLTWQSRSIHILPEGTPPVIRYCQIQQNLKLPKQQYPDPFKCFNKDEDKGLVPLNISGEKAVWRNSHALFQTADGSFKRPDIFNWLARIDNRRQNGEIQAKPNFLFQATGLATDPGKAASVLIWRQERLPLPLKYLEDEKLITKLKEALDVAEEVGKALNNSMWNLAKLIIAPNSDKLNDSQKNEVGKLTDHLSPGRSYWSWLGVSFPRLLTGLAEDKVDDKGETAYGQNTLPWWAGEIRKSARLAFREATDGLDRSGRTLKAVTKAEDAFEFRLNTILKPYKEI